MIRPISISLSPNTEADDVRLAFGQIISFWKWRDRSPVLKLEKEFAERFGFSRAWSFNSGRSCLISILEAAGIGEGDEILVQAFTCNAVPNPILWQGAVPIYVDCLEEDFNMDAFDLERKVTPKSRAVIVQHTFGEPADIDRIRGVCERHNLLLIEDAAHALGAEYKGRPVGSFGDAAFFSFSRDKVISSVYGGMVTAANPEIGERIAGIQKRTKFPSLFWTVQQLFHPLLLNLMVLPVYGIGGKYLLVLFQVFHVLSKAVHRKEKQGGRPSYFPMRLPGPLARLALLQLSKLERMRVHREQIAELYLRELKNTSFVLPRSFPERRSSRLRFPVRNKKAHEIIERAWGKNMLIGDWYTSPVAPADTNLAKMRYEPGSCPVAEALSRETLNLPTHIRCSVLNAEAVVSFLKNYED